MRRKTTEAVSQLSRGGFCYRAAALTSDRRQSGSLREVLLADTGGHETTSRLAHELLPVELAEQHPDQACGVHTARRRGWARARRQGGRPSQVPTSARVLQRAPQYSQVPGRGIPADVRSRQRAQSGHRAGFFRTPEKPAVGDIIEPETLSASEASSGRGWSSHVTCPRSTPFPLGR
jgi:hypothetical protein